MSTSRYCSSLFSCPSSARYNEIKAPPRESFEAKPFRCDYLVPNISTDFKKSFRSEIGHFYFEKMLAFGHPSYHLEERRSVRWATWVCSKINLPFYSLIECSFQHFGAHRSAGIDAIEADTACANKLRAVEVPFSLVACPFATVAMLTGHIADSVCSFAHRTPIPQAEIYSDYDAYTNAQEYIKNDLRQLVDLLNETTRTVRDEIFYELGPDIVSAALVFNGDNVSLREKIQLLIYAQERGVSLLQQITKNCHIIQAVLNTSPDSPILLAFILDKGRAISRPPYSWSHDIEIALSNAHSTGAQSLTLVGQKAILLNKFGMVSPVILKMKQDYEDAVKKEILIELFVTKKPVKNIMNTLGMFNPKRKLEYNKVLITRSVVDIIGGYTESEIPQAQPILGPGI